MKVTVEVRRPEDIRSEAVVVPLLQADPPDVGQLKPLDEPLGGLIARLVENRQLRGRADDFELIHTLGRLPCERLCVAGFGRPADLDLKRLGDIVMRIGRRLRKAHVRSFALRLPELKIDLASAAKLTVESLALVADDFNKYSADASSGPPVLESVTLVVASDAEAAEARRGVARGLAVAEGLLFALELGNEPGNVATPTHLAERAIAMAAESGLSARVIEANEAEKLGMGAFLAVARGSDEPPKLIILEWPGAAKSATPIVFIGKGITFDSGGISLKPRDKMWEMKFDMAGGAAVMGAMKTLAQLKPESRVIGIVPATENLPSGRAIKPGDIVRSLAGLTIEITNTDAEGRLVLADAITYAKREMKPRYIVDFATLTGACVVALGNQAAGLMGNDDALIEKVRLAGARAGERLWPLPLYREYAESMRSGNADLRNSGSPPAGALTAGAFLSRFADGTPWAHVDIAGTAWIDASSPDNDKPLRGATGSGLRTIVELALES